MCVSLLRHMAGLLIASIFMSAAVSANQIQLPDLGDPAESVLSLTAERELGVEIMLEIRKQNLIIEDLIIQEYVSSLGYKLLDRADAAIHDFNFFIINDKTINAFALPGGYIGFNSGLILTTEDESELAAVMAHEISHVTQRHLARAFFHNQNMQGPLLAAMLAAVLMGGEVGKAAMAAASAGSMQSQINFTRKNEYEADRVGIDLLGRSGFDAQSMATLFEKMQKSARLYGGAPPEFLSTHPVHGSRIADARARADRYPKSKTPDSEGYRIVRARLKVLTNSNPHQVAADLKRILSENQSSDELMDRYAMGLALMESGQLDQALTTIADLLKKSGNNKFFELLRAEIEMRSGRDKKAVAYMKKLRQQYPDDHVITLEYARMLIDMDQADSAMSLLDEYRVFRQGDPQVYKLMSHAAKANGEDVKSHAYMAERHRLLGDFSRAISHLETALRSPISDYYLEAKLQAELKELRELQDDEEEKNKNKKN